MQSIKLHEATKQFKIPNKLAMFFLEQKNIPVKSHSSVISMEQLELLREFSSNKEKSDVFHEFNRLEKEKKKQNKLARAAKKDAPDESERPTEAAAQVAVEGTEGKQPPTTEHTPAKPTEEKVVGRESEPVKVEPQSPPVKEPAEVIGKGDGVKRVEVERAPQPPATPPRQQRETRQPEKRKQYEAPEVHKTKKVETRPQRADKSTPPQAAARPTKPDFKKDRPQPHKPTGPGTDKQRKDFKHKEAPKPPSGQKPTAPTQPAARPLRTEATVKPGTPIKPQNKYEQHKKNFRHHDRRAKKSEAERRKQRAEQLPRPKPKPRVYNLPDRIQISDYSSIKELAESLNVKLKDIEDKMGLLKKDFVTNQILAVEDTKAICGEFKVEVDIVNFEDAVFYEHIKKANAELTPRAPVVTVMGHVDHGKTTLLDTLRNARVADREAGGITQKIGAYKITIKGNEIVFLDTPGHEAFTNIRARGAGITDIVILVVAANDGVKPQTIEAINHALAAEVPIVVAINKIDLASADPNRVKQELTKHNILVEDWGGDVVSVDISAKENQNLDSLLEMVSLVSEMLELKAYRNIPARGTVIESRLDPKLGPLGSILIEHGNINRGDYFICGNSIGKIKSIFDDNGAVIQDAEAPMPVEIMGFETVPEAGERFQVVDDLEKAKKVIDLRIISEKDAKKDDIIAGKKLSLQNLFEKLSETKSKEFPIIIKADNFSSCEVLETILKKQNHQNININIVHKGIGNITESDVLLSSTSNSILLGFNVKAPQKILGLAKREQVDVKLYNVIYHLIEDIEKAIKGEMEPEYVETFIGKVEVLQTFKISKLGIIAGCLVKEGKVTNKSKLKVLRNGDLVFEGDIETLRRVKNEAAEVKAGTECGVKVKNFNAIEVGDILEAYESKIKE
ncbi:MAG: translation initiation factor IF-2 [bacterium]|nr:translation initiation factor IF-2 [bacterium]